MPHEVELKFLGTEGELTEELNRLLSGAKVWSDITYKFASHYFDTARRDFLRAGFVLRYRPDSAHYVNNVEIKQLGYDLKRIEVAAHGYNFLSNYFNLLADEDYPTTAPKPSVRDLEEISVVECVRREIFAEIDTGNKKPMKVEFALDQVDYQNPQRKTLGRDTELEIELKQGTVSQFVKWASKASLPRGIESKAIRSFRHLNIT